MTIDSQTCRATAAAGGDCAAEKCLAANDNHDFVSVYVSMCVCVCEMLFARFQFPKFSPGEKATQKAAIRLSRLPIRYDIYTYTIYSYAQYVSRYCFIFLCLYVCFALEKRCEATLIVSVG